MLVRTIEAALRSRATQVIVVLGHESAAVAAALDAAGLNAASLGAGRERLQLTHAEDHGAGLSASLRRGVALAAERRMDGVLVCLGDMPLVRPATLDLLLRQPEIDARALAWVPTMQGERGNPVLWRSTLFEALLGLSGDRGGRLLLERHAPHVREVPVGDPGVLEDFDTPQRLASYAAS
jgi:molybdenum cofactor cytidylyltransferase